MEAVNWMWNNGYMLLYALLFLISIYRYPKYFDTPMRILPLLLAYTLTTEVIGMLIRDYPEFSLFIEDYHKNNNWLLYNIYGILEFLAFIWVFSRYITRFNVRPFITLTLSGFILVSIWNAIQWDFRTVSQVYAYWWSAGVLMILIGLYLYQEWKRDPRTGFQHNLLVWISIGLFIFSLAYAPIDYLRFLVVHDGLEYYSWIRPLHLSVIYIYYGCMLLGLLFMDPMKYPDKKTRLRAGL